MYVFQNDNETMTAAFSNEKMKNGSYLGYLAFDSSMVRYAQDRFVDVELILEDQSGLKITEISDYKEGLLCNSGRLSYPGRKVVTVPVY